MSRIAPTVRIAILAIAIMVAAVFCSLELKGNPAGLLSNPPELRAKHQTLSLTLHAGIASDGKNSFYFNGRPNAPTLRLSPGDQLKITYVNDLPTKAKESCAITPCMDMTNLHFHGLTVSPDAPQDDVLDMMAVPGQSLRYTVQIPQDHPPGLYWYHTHPHGESHRQALDGMSGALVIEGIESYFPPLVGLRERVLVVRGRYIVNDPQSADLKHRVELNADSCGAEPEAPEEVFTAEEKAPPQFTVTVTEDKKGFYINGEKFTPSAAPMTRVKVGTFQHWRIVNATRELHPMHIHQVHFLAYAENGRPVAEPMWLDTVNVPFGGSVDVIMDFTDPVIRGMSVFHCHLL